MNHTEALGVARPPVRQGESPWSDDELEAVRGELARDVDQLQFEIETTDEAVRAVRRGDCALDAADAGTTQAAVERLCARREEARSRQGLALAALERLRDGTFGLCTSCGRGIGKTRASALPYAELCIGCRRQWEHTLRAAS